MIKARDDRGGIEIGEFKQNKAHAETWALSFFLTPAYSSGLPRLSGLGLWLSFLGGGRLSLLEFVTTITFSFGGRLSRSFFCANAPVDTMPSIAITRNSRISFIIFSHFSSCQVPRMGGRKSCADQEAARKVPRRFMRRVYQQSHKFARFRTWPHGMV